MWLERVHWLVIDLEMKWNLKLRFIYPKTLGAEKHKNVPVWSIGACVPPWSTHGMHHDRQSGVFPLKCLVVQREPNSKFDFHVMDFIMIAPESGEEFVFPSLSSCMPWRRKFKVTISWENKLPFWFNPDDSSGEFHISFLVLACKSSRLSTVSDCSGSYIRPTYIRPTFTVHSCLQYF